MDLDKIKLLYKATSEVANSFWEWRHKVMTRFFIVAGATFLSASWMYNIIELRRWSCLPFLLGSIYSLVSYLLDRVNTWTLRECYKHGSLLEKELSSDGGIFTSIYKIHYRQGSYA